MSFPMSDEQVRKPVCFLALPYVSVSVPVRMVIEASAEKAGFDVVSPDRLAMRPVSTIQEIVIGEIARADCVIADMTGRNPNVFFELGLAQAMGKAIFLVIARSTSHEMPSDLRGYQHLTYDDNTSGLDQLGNSLERALREYLASPRPTRSMIETAFSRPFFVDWDRLDRLDAENLVQELLAQMGYRRIDWEKESKEIDLVAELPKKDPDGFEYRELWFVAMGRNMTAEMLLEIVNVEPEYFLHKSMRDVERIERLSSRGSDVPVTVLVIDWRGDTHLDRWQNRLRPSKRLRRSNVRVRLWDRNYLTSLVHQFPLLGYKYFSDEARSRSKHRKTYEDLYNENAALTTRLTNALSALEEEKNKRVRAERDAVWKDISFSAAHKIGNPVFAIETALDPLERRISEKRTSEALSVINSIRISMEKAKAIIDQFKSLTRAQKIRPVRTLLLPILENACQSVETENVHCTIVCDSNFTILGDPDRLTECFDELVRNSTHWFNKDDKQIRIEVKESADEPLPESLDSNQKYAFIRYTDNGAGVPLEIKDKIFNAFFTKRNHGTGIGLALVRRVMEGHGGIILENGIPGQGAVFEIYIPAIQGSVEDESRKLEL